MQSYVQTMSCKPLASNPATRVTRGFSRVGYGMVLPKGPKVVLFRDYLIEFYI